ncbi:MAG: HD domain-containing protein [bacterium]
MESEKEILKRFNKLISMIGPERKKEVNALIRYLKKDGEYFKAPASRSEDHHLPYPGGLLEHSVNVAEYMLKLREILAPELPIDSVIIVGLFHDVGKIGSMGKPLYIPNPKKTERKEQPYVYNLELVRMAVPIRSLYILLRFIRLSEEEVQAICYHDGQYVPENEIVAHYEHPLTLLVHFADFWCATIVERQKDKK